MLKFVNEILMGFRSCFSRRATYEWFVVIVVGLLVRTDHLGVTSIIRGLWLSGDYMGLIGFFRSSAWTLETLMAKWWMVVKEQAPLVKHRDAVVMVGDGVKEAKEGRRMPGVKRQHQESDNSKKANYIWGHLFGGIGVLAEKSGKRFCLPLALMLHDGVRAIFGWDNPDERQGSHVVETIKLAHSAAVLLGKAILLLDRLYLTIPALQKLDELNASGQTMNIVTKAKRNCVAYQLPQSEPGKRGRPRKKGEAVKLFDLFSSGTELFDNAEICLYGKSEKVRYHCADLLWGQGLYKMLRFVFVEYNQTRTVLVSTDLTIEPIEIIQLYGKRFSIEMMFREMKQVAGAFGYRFWSKYLPKLNRFSKKNDPAPAEQVTDPHARKRIKMAVKAIEGFMFCSLVATGLLQLSALHFAGSHELAKLRYLLTVRNSVPSEASVSDFFKKNFFALLQTDPTLPINLIISAKQSLPIDMPDFYDAA
jgi:hypothetical protein